MSNLQPLELVALAQTGIPEQDIRAQLEALCRSATFENQGNTKRLLRYLVAQALEGKEPNHAQIARDVFNKPDIDPGDTQVRTETKKLRLRLKEFYECEAKEGEIKFEIPERRYSVLAPKRAGEAHGQRGGLILEPADRTEVHQRVPVKGRIDKLNPDWRAWLVVRTPCGDLYPQCRVSRQTPDWRHEVRLGLVQ